MENIPFGTTEWSTVEPTVHKGESGEATWRTRHFGPDDNRIIFAHDLAPTEVPKSPAWWKRNQPIFDYYARHQPERQFILFDRALVDLQTTNAFEELGRAPEAAARARREAGQ